MVHTLSCFLLIFFYFHPRGFSKQRIQSFALSKAIAMKGGSEGSNSGNLQGFIKHQMKTYNNEDMRERYVHGPGYPQTLKQQRPDGEVGIEQHSKNVCFEKHCCCCCCCCERHLSRDYVDLCLKKAGTRYVVSRKRAFKTEHLCVSGVVIFGFVNRSSQQCKVKDLLG